MWEHLYKPLNAVAVRCIFSSSAQYVRANLAAASNSISSAHNCKFEQKKVICILFFLFICSASVSECVLVILHAVLTFANAGERNWNRSANTLRSNRKSVSSFWRLRGNAMSELEKKEAHRERMHVCTFAFCRCDATEHTQQAHAAVVFHMWPCLAAFYVWTVCTNNNSSLIPLRRLSFNNDLAPPVRSVSYTKACMCIHSLMMQRLRRYSAA